jgi:formylglycine-generating enzyme required for sulfatase activity
VAQKKAPPPVADGWGGATNCTYLASSDQNDAMPVNCVSYATAKAACAAKGKRLPSEAEWEWAAGNQDAESDAPWGPLGDLSTICANAVVGRGSAGSSCLQLNDKPGVQVGNALDVTELGLKNLAGNVNEWTSDVFRPYDDPACWGSTIMFRKDPHCEEPGDQVIRGGTWSQLPAFARVSSRGASVGGGPSSATGFRCAK